VSKVRTRGGKRAGLGDTVAVPAYQGETAVIVGIRRGCALLEFTTPPGGNEWLPGDVVELVQRRNGPVTADCCPVTPGLKVNVTGFGYAVTGTVRRPGLLDLLRGRVPVEFAGGTVLRYRGTDLYSVDEEDLYLL